MRYVPDGSLCTASAEQIFPRDSVQRNCFELALYTTRDHDCISDRIGWGIRNIRDADVGSLRSVRSQRRRRYIARSSCRTIIGSGDMLLAPHHHQLRRSHRSIHCWHGHAARRSALPRERFSPMTQLGLDRLPYASTRSISEICIRRCEPVHIDPVRLVPPSSGALQRGREKCVPSFLPSPRLRPSSQLA